MKRLFVLALLFVVLLSSLVFATQTVKWHLLLPNEAIADDSTAVKCVGDRPPGSTWSNWIDLWSVVAPQHPQKYRTVVTVIGADAQVESVTVLTRTVSTLDSAVGADYPIVLDSGEVTGATLGSSYDTWATTTSLAADSLKIMRYFQVVAKGWGSSTTINTVYLNVSLYLYNGLGEIIAIDSRTVPFTIIDD